MSTDTRDHARPRRSRHRSRHKSQRKSRPRPGRPALAFAIGAAISVALIAAAWQYSRNRGNGAADEAVSGPQAGSDLAAYTIVVAGIDSLTDGVLGTDWRRYFRQATIPRLGDGGPGWASFSKRGVEDHGATFTYTGFRPFHLGSAQGAMSLDGEGIVTTRGGSLSWSEPGSWRRARIYFLPGSESSALRCNDAQIGIDGTTGLAWADIPGPGRIECTAQGELVVFGALFLADRPGLVIVNMARSGRRLADVAAQDAGYRARWFAALGPDVFLVNAGSNDWREDTPAIHKADLRKLVGDAQSGAPAMKVFLVQPNAPGGDRTAEEHFANAIAKQELADELGIGLIDVEEKLGPYGVARHQGLIMDSVHPSDRGNRILGPYFARKVFGQ